MLEAVGHVLMACRDQILKSLSCITMQGAAVTAVLVRVASGCESTAIVTIKWMLC